MKRKFAIVIPLVLLPLLSLGSGWEWLVKTIFVVPSAWIASVMTGSAVIEGESGFPVLLHRLTSVEVVPECGGYSFWMILFTLLVWRLLRYGGSVRCIAAAIPLSYAVAVLTNGLRISAVIHTSFMSRTFLPASLSATVHAWTGVLVFVPVLCVIFWLIERRFHYGEK